MNQSNKKQKFREKLKEAQYTKNKDVQGREWLVFRCAVHGRAMRDSSKSVSFLL